MDTPKSPKGYFKVDDEAQEIAYKKKSLIRRWLLVLASVLALLGVTIGVLVSVTRSQRNYPQGSPPSPPTPELTPAASLKNVCSVTKFPDACVSSISKIPSSNTTDPEVLFRLSLKVVVDELASISDLPRKLAEETDDEGIKSALGVCGQMLDGAMDSVNDTVSAMEVGDGKKILNAGKIEDLKTWLTAAATYYETCFDTLAEISPNQSEHKTAIVSQNLTSAMKNSTEFTSNSLAIVAKILSTLSDFKVPIHRRRLLSSNSFPVWVSPRVRRLLSAKSVTPHVTVAKDGSGDVYTVNEAVAKIPRKSNTTFVIYVKAGTYVENVFLDKSVWNVMMYGDGKSKSIISGSKNFGGDGIKTLLTATLDVIGKGFIMKDMGIINTAGPEKEQAVAFHSQSDHSVYYQCSFDGYQDTLYPHSNRQFYRDCDVTGTVDFIFGHAAVVFQGCTIRPRQPLPKQYNTITAQGNTEETHNGATVIQGCTITANGNVTAATYLGRPWKNYSVTVFMQSDIGPLVEAAGWMRWDATVDPPSTIFYGEYENWGPGAGVTKRVNWAGYKPTMSAAEARRFTVDAFINEEHWLPATGVFEDPVQGIICYTDDNGEVICDGPRCPPQSPMVASYSREVEIPDLLQRSYQESRVAEKDDGPRHETKWL
ncbi:putative pectinesterase/pectinesterase inhibitor 26 [Hirschfeldia incana]|nr:putative pectinesterase/pectinesterase inhibitor 26 [Hirschfeldia incana]